MAAVTQKFTVRKLTKGVYVKRDEAEFAFPEPKDVAKNLLEGIARRIDSLPAGGELEFEIKTTIKK